MSILRVFQLQFQGILNLNFEGVSTSISRPLLQNFEGVSTSILRHFQCQFLGCFSINFEAFST